MFTPVIERLSSMTRILFSRRPFVFALVCFALTLRATAADFDQACTLFDNVLKQYVKDARVDYAALKAQPQELNRYLDEVAAVKRADFEHWSQSQQIAFLINAYNAYTLRLIIENYPVKSIKDIGSFLNGPWDQPVVKLFGETMTLNTVEHKMLRKDYAEPRIHFALVCAAKGCPPLRNEAYVADRLNEQLDDQAKQFLATPAKNRVDAAEHTVYLSPIFKWYGGDFEKKSGSVLAALKPYWPPKTPATDDFKIRFTDYDWTLNEQAK
jgi:hypothetical protein